MIIQWYVCLFYACYLSFDCWSLGINVIGNASFTILAVIVIIFAHLYLIDSD